MVVCMSCGVAVLCVHFNLSEALVAWARPLERFQVDEFPGVILGISLVLVWYSLRRYREADRELRLRKAAEKNLAEVSAENRRLARKYAEMQEFERKALARDLHDELGQYINAIKLDAVGLRAATMQGAAEHILASTMIANIDRIYEVVRGLIHELRPVGLDDLGVAAALEHCVGEWRARLPGTSITIDISGDLEGLSEATGMLVYRLVQEAMTNMARHSAATMARVRIARMANPDRTEIWVRDDGHGVDLAAPRAGLGLVGMRERVASVRGMLSITSAPGKGFMVSATSRTANEGP